ncbi:Fe-S cluster assembly ATPase SufC [Candidatus Pacearchaeota archaeon]|nr:Fe-S cluster assembly ATPase SufC [Candidatus Pacearchaeota archaeon]
MLDIKNLHVEVDGKNILRGVNLSINDGEIHAIMGANGSGKSTLAMALMGHPNYKITSGEIFFNGQLINDMKSSERARLGMFLSMQNPIEVEGVKLGSFLWQSARTLEKVYGKNVIQFRNELKEKISSLNMPDSFIDRDINHGFSGGEKKKSELVQMSMLKPKFAIIDEVDSGLDIDSLKIISSHINNMKDRAFSGLLITHYQRILNYVKPDYIHVMINGRIIASGGDEIVRQIEEKGYGSF